MRIAASSERSMADLTARARIRDAAIACFAEAGFDTPFRTIAARADVSPGLITHHFGSKAALRAECDAEVFRRYHALKSDTLDDPSANLLERLARPGDAALVTVYMLRALHAGGTAARDFFESLVEHVRQVTAESVAAGLVRPSRDEDARARYLTAHSMGAMLVQYLLDPGRSPDDFVASVLTQERGQALPILELYTEGLFTNRRMLDEYLMYVGDPPVGAVVPADAGATAPTA
ncbi:TetR/AcrR family transcriptional regulator [Actinotalea fermentans]|nr:TetR family transcriptional regulator [Actinotalea fermentans]KGM17954.1 TetR family transcriptional regulator [Actinotalea fermentans ATCC 43279 = JCM 9966 = DSM 3133]